MNPESGKDVSLRDLLDFGQPQRVIYPMTSGENGVFPVRSPPPHGRSGRQTRRSDHGWGISPRF